MFPADAFAIINFLIALFVLTFSIFYLKSIWESKSRDSWLILGMGVLVLFVLQAANMLSVAGYFSIEPIRWIFDLVFLVILLMLFIFQYSLISASQKIHSKKKK